jgi:hypothetical protein
MRADGAGDGEDGPRSAKRMVGGGGMNFADDVVDAPAAVPPRFDVAPVPRPRQPQFVRRPELRRIACGGVGLPESIHEEATMRKYAHAT